MEKFNFSNYCSSCTLYDSIYCPYKDKVDGITNWKTLNCQNFSDIDKIYK